MTRHVLEGGHDLAVAQLAVGAGAGQPFYRGNTHFADKVGILAEGLFDPAPARIARDVDNRGEDQMDAARADLASNQVVDLADEIGIPGAGQANGLRKSRRVFRRETVKRLLMEEDGNAETGVLHRPALCIDHILDAVLDAAARHFARTGGAETIGRTRDLTDPVWIACGRLYGIEHIAVALDLVLTVPDGDELSDFLVQSHARKQVFDALFDRQRCVPVRRVAHRPLDRNVLCRCSRYRDWCHRRQTKTECKRRALELPHESSLSPARDLTARDFVVALP